MDVRIDGVDGGAALGVMSQGELHALGLSLFLPRATVDQSPFRFVLIDDPVQAMDPAKVDGLARVLAEVATTARSSSSPTTTGSPMPCAGWRRRRRSGRSSAVNAPPLRCAAATTRQPLPRRRSCDGADGGLPPDIRSELVASCCRSAVEAACHAKIRAVRLAAGHTHAEVEAALSAATTTSDKVTFAVFDDPGRGSDLLGRIKAAGPEAVDAFKSARRAPTTGLTGDLRPFVRDVEKLAEWLQR